MGQCNRRGTFRNSTFHVEVLWDDFQHCLLVGTTQGDPVAVFGPYWNDRNAWVLSEVGYGQENYNAASGWNSTTSVVEGAFQSVEVLSVGYRLPKNKAPLRGGPSTYTMGSGRISRRQVTLK